MNPPSRLTHTFAECKRLNQPLFVAYVTAGFPDLASTPKILLALQQGGAHVIELGIPFTDPLADGQVIQHSSQVALKNNVSVPTCLDMVRDARARGLTVPIILMGYYNPILQYGPSKIVVDARDAGCDGFIIVDLPIDEAIEFRHLAHAAHQSYIPLITPSTNIDRIKTLVGLADSFIYVVSRLGVTGQQATVSVDLPHLIQSIRGCQGATHVPLAVGFGVANRDQFVQISKVADGVVVGSKLISVIQAACDRGADHVGAVKQFALDITGNASVQPAAHIPYQSSLVASPPAPQAVAAPPKFLLNPRFGEFGGQYAPEVLITALTELEKAFVSTKHDPAFWMEFESQYAYMGRPSPLHLASRLTDPETEARIWLKREDLNHTGSHKINNAMGQVLLAKRLGKTRIIAETGAGQHGVATATVCAKFGLKCVVYMGAVDCARQQLNVFRIRLLGGTVVPVESGSRTLKDAINEAMRDWVTNLDSTYYLVGSAIGPHPFPSIVREFQSVIGKESILQFQSEYPKLAGAVEEKKYPDAVVACVGGGSNAIGLFAPYIDDPNAHAVMLVGAEAAGMGMDLLNSHSATVLQGTPGVLHGTMTLLLQDSHGQISDTHSISAGLDYPGVGPEHAHLFTSKRAQYRGVTDDQCLDAFKVLANSEGIIPALETAHAVHSALELAKDLGRGKDIILCVSGRGDKDVAQVMPLVDL